MIRKTKRSDDRLSRTRLATALAAALGIAALSSLPVDTAAAAGHRFRDVTSRTHVMRPGSALHRAAGSHHAALLAQLHTRYGSAHAAAPGHAPVTRSVSSCADGGAGSLRDAVTNASSGDIIDLSTLTCSTISLTTGAIATSLDDLTIKGPGASHLTIDADGSHDRAIAHFGTGTLTLDDVTVANGYYYGSYIASGGCVLSAGTLVLNNSTVTNCYTVGYISVGGGTYSAGPTTLSNSTLSGNVSYGYDDGTYGRVVALGGGAYSGGLLTLAGSTVSGNIANGYSTQASDYSPIRGGGVYGSAGTMINASTVSGNTALYTGAGVVSSYGSTIIQNSTLADNSSVYGYGGGLFSLGSPTITLDHATVANNYAYYSGGGSFIVYSGAPTTLQSSIVSGNSDADNNSSADMSYYGSYYTVAGANNLVGASILTLPADTLNGDPLLGALADNGGPTQTMALGTGSPAIDTGNNSAGLAFDQRGTGFSRVSGAASDIGAFEVQAQGQVVLPPYMAVPTLSQWSRWLLAGLVSLLALGGLARRRRPSA